MCLHVCTCVYMCICMCVWVGVNMNKLAQIQTESAIKDIAYCIYI